MTLNNCPLRNFVNVMTDVQADPLFSFYEGDYADVLLLIRPPTIRKALILMRSRIVTTGLGGYIMVVFSTDILSLRDWKP